MDISNSELEIKDALLEKMIGDHFSLRAGNFKEDFRSKPLLLQDIFHLLKERTWQPHFGPSRHIGVDATYNKNMIFATTGLFFQEMAVLKKEFSQKITTRISVPTKGTHLRESLFLCPAIAISMPDCIWVLPGVTALRKPILKLLAQ